MNAPHYALYYPRYAPNPDWLRLQLLFWDSVFRIVPEIRMRTSPASCWNCSPSVLETTHKWISRMQRVHLPAGHCRQRASIRSSFRHGMTTGSRPSWGRQGILTGTQSSISSSSNRRQRGSSAGSSTGSLFTRPPTMQ